MNSRVIEALRHLNGARTPSDATPDRELLAAFIARRDGSAFATLVHRHGPMVLGVCRRMLGHHQDAEDAFQATFLVLARRATSVTPRGAVANWLYGVAYRTALEARRMAARRRAREARFELFARSEVMEPVVDDLSVVLDDELSRLPDRLRLPVVLCDLEGRTRRDAARQLQIADGTLSNRLAAARRLLAKRLRARGVTLSVGGLAIAMGQTGMSAVPLGLANATIQAALDPAANLASAAASSLTHEVVKTMYLSKLKVLAAVFLLIGGAAGAGIHLASHAETAEPPAMQSTNAESSSPSSAKAADLKTVLAKAAEEMKAVKATTDQALRRKADQLVHIGHSQARYGDKTGAAATFQEAISVAEGIQNEDQRAEAIANAGFYQANAGLTSDALKTVAKISLKSKQQTQEYRARVQAEAATRTGAGRQVR